MATPFRLKRSAVASKRPETTNLQLGELALNTYDGHLYTEREGVGLATVTNLTPWYENYGGDSIYYGNSVGIGTTNPTVKLDVVGNVQVSGITSFYNGDVYFVGSHSDASNNRIHFDQSAGGGTFNIQDRLKLQIGTNAIAQLHVNPALGTTVTFNSRLSNNHLHVVSDHFKIKSLTDDEKYLEAEKDGAVKIFHNGNEKLETLERGVGIAGSITVSNDLSVTGISTFAGVVRINSGITPDTDEGAYLGSPTYPWSSAHIGEVKIASGGNNNEIDTATGNLILDSAGGTTTIDDHLGVTGVSTFTGAIDANGDLDVDGHTELDNLNVSGITTSARLNVTGITTVATLNIGVSGQTLVGITTILDEDNMASDSATALVTQQSIKKYVDDNITAQDLDVTSDSGTIAIDLDSETLDIAGTANEIETSATGNEVTIGLPDNVTIGNNLTVTNDVGIGASLNVTGISTFGEGIHIPTAKNAMFGTLISSTTADFEISHDGNNNTVLQNRTGGVYIKGLGASGNAVYMQPKNNESSATFHPDGAVDLFFNNHQRFNTTGYGVSVSGFESIGIATFHNNVDVNGNADVSGSLTVGSGGLDLNGNGDISGNLVVGAAGTTITTTVGAAASVGIGTANPAYMLDVAGAINSSNDVKINGTSVLTSALNEAVAMAIALG